MAHKFRPVAPRPDINREKPMAKVADIEVEFKQSERIALIDSAVKLVTIFSNREPTLLPPQEYGSKPSLTTEESQAYRSALEFLAIQYNGQCRVEIALPKMPEMSETDLGCM